MLLNIFDTSNSITVNYRTIQLFGLPTAVYFTELLNIYKKATNKNKLIDEKYFKVDRTYINKMISLTVEEQLVCDLNLIKTSILKKSADNPDILTLDINLYLSLLSSEDVKLTEDVRKLMKTQKPKGTKLSQRQYLINNLKDSIECSNYELLTALRGWVDGVYSNPNGFLSKQSIKIFQQTLNDYTKGDLDLALQIVNVATTHGYRDCQWAINYLEKNKKISNLKINKNNVRVTEQKVATKADLSDIVF